MPTPSAPPSTPDPTPAAPSAAPAPVADLSAAVTTPPATATATTDTDRFLRYQNVIADLPVWGGEWSCSESKEVLSCGSLCTLYIRCPVRQTDGFRMRTIPQPRPASQDVSRSAFLASFVTVTDNM